MRATQDLGTIVVAGLAVLLAGVLLAGCIPIATGQFGTTRDRQPSPSTSVPANSSPALVSPAMVGSWLSAGSWKVLVIRARTLPKGPGGARARSGKSFLLIDVEFKNVRMTEALVVNAKDFSLKDASGKQIAMAGTNSGCNARGMRVISPGYGGTTIFSYQIPKGSSGYTFTFSPKVSGKRAKLQWGVP